MASVSIVDGTFPLGTTGFKIYIWELNMSADAERPTLQLEDSGGLQTTGYNSKGWQKVHSATYTQATIPAAVTTRTDATGLNNAGLVYGYFEGTLLDASTDLWGIYGKFRDDDSTDISEVEIFDQVTLDDQCVGFRVASGDATTWTAGDLAWQSWC